MGQKKVDIDICIFIGGTSIRSLIYTTRISGRGKHDKVN